MSNSGFNQANAIAVILCPYLRSSSPKLPYRSRVDRNAEVDEIYRLLQTFGGRKSFFQTKTDYVSSSILQSETIYAAVSSFIELARKLPDGAREYWTGDGQVKKKGNYFGPLAFLQIDITHVFGEVAPFLEKLPTGKSKVELQRDPQLFLRATPDLSDLVFQNQETPIAVKEFILAVYGNPPPPKRANVSMAAKLAFDELLMRNIDQEEVATTTCEFSYTPIPFSTYDLALSASLNLFRQPEYMPRLKTAQLVARVKAIQWLQEGLAVSAFVKNFEEVLYKLYKSEH